MHSSLVFTVLTGISASIAMDVTSICEEVRTTDAIVCSKIENPSRSDRERVFEDIRDYLNTLPSFYEALQADPQRATEVCKDVLDVGTPQFMNMPYDYDRLVQGFGWTDDEMNKYRDLRDNALSEWLKIEPYIPANREDRLLINADIRHRTRLKCTIEMHEALKPLSWLFGKWLGVNGFGEYPTIAPFKYCEEVEFLSLGQPLLNYTSKTWHPDNKLPMHFESGFLRINPGTNQVAFMLSHNFGVSEIEEGVVQGNKLELHTRSISRMSFAKKPAVREIHREFSLEGDVLRMTLSMATTETPLTKHLSIDYHKVQIVR